VIKSLCWIVMGWVIVCSAGRAEVAVHTSLLDERVTTLEYRKGEVYSINARQGQQTIVRFHEDEGFRFIGSGKSTGWEIFTHEHILSIIPLSHNVDTNLNVTTQDRITGEVRYYVFELNALNVDSNEIGTWSIEFKNTKGREQLHYSAPFMAAVTPALPEAVHIPDTTLRIELSAMDFRYGYSGDDVLTPLRIFDDGKFTYFEFPQDMAIPIILTVEGGEQRLIVNRHEEGIYTVVQQVADEYVLILGDLETRIYHQGTR